MQKLIALCVVALLAFPAVAIYRDATMSSCEKLGGKMKYSHLVVERDGSLTDVYLCDYPERK